MESESVSLFFREGASDKEYHAQLEPKNGGWVVNFQYGRRGAALRSDAKTPSALPYDQAKKVYTSLVREKIGKGYRPLPHTAPAPVPVPGGESKATLPCELLTSIELAQVATYILDPNYWMQDKRDGHRRMVRKTADGALVGINRRGLAVPLPARLYTELCRLALKTFLLDGEIEGERLVVFDLLEADGDLTPAPYAVRFERLAKELLPSRSSATELPHIIPVPTWRTSAEKEAGLEELYTAKAEGVVFKRTDAPYAAGRTGSHLKFKFTATCSARVRRLNAKRSVGLELLDAAGTWLDIGNVSVSVRHDVPSIGSLVEVRYLYATSARHLYQPVYLGIREDITETECSLSQLKFKKEEAEA